MSSKFVYALSTLAGTIIGVGLFSLPYLTSRVGLGVIFLYFSLLTLLVTVVHRLYGEVVLRTPGLHRLPGYARIHLGRLGRGVAVVSTILGLLGALLAYLIVGSGFLTALLSPRFGGPEIVYALIYLALAAWLIFWGIKAVAKIEFWGLLFFFLVLGLIFWQGRELINLGELFSKFWLPAGAGGHWFLPYGPILFSLWGAALIPEVKEVLSGRGRLLRRLIPLAIILPAVVYLIFILIVLGVSGEATSPEAISGLKNRLGDGIVTLGFSFGLITTFTSFITLGLTLTKVFWYDLRLSHRLAWFLACFTPLGLYLLGLQDFIRVIGLVGAVMLGLDGILILLMYQKVAPVPARPFWVYPLFLIFLLGILYELFYFAG